MRDTLTTYAPLPAGDGDAADLEFIATTDETNLEDQLAMLSEAAASVPVEAEVPLHLEILEPSLEAYPASTRRSCDPSNRLGACRG